MSFAHACFVVFFSGTSIYCDKTTVVLLRIFAITSFFAIIFYVLISSAPGGMCSFAHRLNSYCSALKPRTKNLTRLNKTKVNLYVVFNYSRTRGKMLKYTIYSSTVYVIELVSFPTSLVHMNALQQHILCTCIVLCSFS